MNQGMSLVVEELREIKRAQREAKALWSSARSAAGFPRFTDRAALRSVGFAVERVWGTVQWRDIETAIREHAAMQYTKSPWLLDEWARQAQLDRETKETATLPVEEQLRRMRAARR